MRRDQGETDSELCKGKEGKKNENHISKFCLLSLLNNKIDNKIDRKIKTESENIQIFEKNQN